MKSLLVFRLLFASASAMSAAGRAAAVEELRPGIIGDDDRRPLTEPGPPWDAVGQVNVGGYRVSGQCTGTLVAPMLVVTAAHCVLRPGTGGPFPLHDIHFLAGVRGGSYKGHATARCVHFVSNPEPDAPATKPVAVKHPLAAFADDMAVIVLQNEVGIAPAPLAVTVAPDSGLELAHVAYPGDRRFLPVVHFGCHLRAVAGPFWFTDCDSHPGSSGGPLFVKQDGAYAVAAIMVAAGSRKGNVALPLTDWIERPETAACP